MLCETIAVPTRQRQSTLALKKLEKLSDELATAEHASEATTKKVQRARGTTRSVKRDVRRELLAVRTVRKRKVSKAQYTKDGRNKAAVELGKKGGAARARTMTPKQRSSLATKAANTRWKAL